MPPEPTLHDVSRRGDALWAFCPSCGHAKRLSAASLALEIGINVKLADAGERMRCTRCRWKGCVVVPDARAVARARMGQQ